MIKGEMLIKGSYNIVIYLMFCGKSVFIDLKDAKAKTK